MPQITDTDDHMQIDEENMKELMKNVNLKELMQNMQQQLEMDDEGEDDDEHSEDEEEEMDLPTVLSQFFLDSKKNRNICDIMCEMKRNMETQNKILIELLNTLKKQ